jgi:FAD/FMN-containing dehydrogenase
MQDIQGAAARATGTKLIQASEITELRQALTGPLLSAADEGYDPARRIWNAMIDRRPALIARCQNAADVQESVNFARRHALLLSVRGGGHNIAGLAVCEGGLMIDLSLMRSVSVDAGARSARVDAGATLRDLDSATAAHGLAVPLGINSTTGIAGLTLGGGFGWLSRKYGLTLDHLIGADVVTADGELVRASEADNPNLFWALRGGGGNFGIVTRFDFRLHALGPDVLCGLVVYPAEQGASLLRRYREVAGALSDETSAWVILRKAPPLPFLPAEAHGRDVVVFAFVHTGDVADGQRAIEPLRRMGSAYGEHVGVLPFADWQQAFDPLLTEGARNYWKSHNFDRLQDELFDVLLEAARHVPSPECEVFIGQLGCATARVAPDATAYTHRSAQYVMNVHGRWRNDTDDDSVVRWARELYRKAAPFATGGVYVNFLTGEEGERIIAAYGPNYERLRAAKRLYDPQNLFRMNQNIPPIAP